MNSTMGTGNLRKRGASRPVTGSGSLNVNEKRPRPGIDQMETAAHSEGGTTTAPVPSLFSLTGS